MTAKIANYLKGELSSKLEYSWVLYSKLIICCL
jgi:hypothetical protein